MAGLGLLDTDPRYRQFGDVSGAYDGEMRSGNEPLIDWLIGKTGAYGLNHPLANSAVRAGNRFMDAGAKTVQELTMVPQLVRTGESLATAANEPSIPNVTRAGVDVAASAFRPAAALKMGGAGLLAAGAKDVGLLDLMGGPATAQQAKARKPESAPIPDLPGMTPEQNARYKAVMGQMASGNFGSGAERRALEAEAAGFRDLAQKFQLLNMTNTGEADAAKKKGEQAEYDRAVMKAETVRDAELTRQRRFSDTTVGQTWDKLGGWGPFLVAGGIGGLSRMATGGSKNLYNYALPAGEGAVGGALSTNVPLAYNAFMTEPDNPEKRAYEAYARELPPTHPRKAEWDRYAAGLPKANPVRETASDELYNPTKAAERMVFGSIEGIGGGLAGANIVRVPGTIIDRASRYPGRAVAGVRHGMADADLAAIRRSGTSRAAQEAQADYAAAAEEANKAMEAARKSRGAKRPEPPQPPVQEPTIDPAAAAATNSPAARARRFLNTF